MEKLTHKHHIVPKYMGGTDDADNLVEVTITQHAMFHYCNWRLWGNDEDKIAWKGLSRSLGKENIIKEKLSLGGKKGGKKGGGGKKSKENKTGLFALSKEQLSEQGKIGAQRCKELGVGIFSLTLEQRIENGRKNGKKGGKNTGNQKWQCLETGFIANPGNLTQFQRKRGIDTSKRIRIE